MAKTRTVRMDIPTHDGFRELAKATGLSLQAIYTQAGIALAAYMRGDLSDGSDVQGQANLAATAKLSANILKQVGIEATIDLVSLAEGHIDYRVRVTDPGALRRALASAPDDSKLDFPAVFGRSSIPMEE